MMQVKEHPGIVSNLKAKTLQVFRHCSKAIRTDISLSRGVLVAGCASTNYGTSIKSAGCNKFH